jgi:hypothetical protein
VQRPLSKNINSEWTELKDARIIAADEVSGRRKKYSKRGSRSWNQNMAELIAEKRESYLHCERRNKKSEWKQLG